MQSIDLVYTADPPFNSNKNHEAPIGSKAASAAFKDTWTLSDVDLAWHGEIAEREPKVYAAIDNAGIVHGKRKPNASASTTCSTSVMIPDCDAKRGLVPRTRQRLADSVVYGEPLGAILRWPF